MKTEIQKEASKNGVHRKRPRNFPPPQAKSPEEDAEIVERLASDPIVLGRPVQTESITDDIVQNMVTAVRETIMSRLSATDRHLSHRTIWAISSQQAKVDRMRQLMDIALQSAARLPDTFSATSAPVNVGLIRQNITKSIRIVDALLNQFADDQKRQAEGIELEIRRLFSPSELFYGDGPSEEEMMLVAKASKGTGGAGAGTTEFAPPRLAPETIMSPPREKQKLPVIVEHVDGKEILLPGPQYLSEEEREKAIQEVVQGVRPIKIAKKYRIKLRTVRAWIERHRPRKRKRKAA